MYVDIFSFDCQIAVTKWIKFSHTIGVDFLWLYEVKILEPSEITFDKIWFGWPIWCYRRKMDKIIKFSHTISEDILWQGD